MFIKTKEFRQSDNDIYFIQTISDKIIVNDNYDGVLILDNNLNLIKVLKIFEGITVYSSFLNNINEEILLFCPDNECMVYINLTNYDYKVIYLKNGFEELVFSNIYEWNMNCLILSTYNGEFYSVSINENNIQKIDYKEVEKEYTELYTFYCESKNYEIFRLFLDKNIAIINEKDRNIHMVIYKDQTKHVFYNVTTNFIDIDYREGVLAIVNENMVEIATKDDKVLIYPEENYMFLQGRLLNKLNSIYFIGLSSSNLNNSYSRVDMFQLYTL